MYFPDETLVRDDAEPEDLRHPASAAEGRGVRQVRCSVALGLKKRVPMRYLMKAHTFGSAERTYHLGVRGGSTVLAVKPLERSPGE